MNEKKVCSQCGEVYSSDAEICPLCNVALIECEVEPEKPFEVEDVDKAVESCFPAPADESNVWMYITTFLFPLAGMFLSTAKVIRGENAEGKYLMITSLIAFAVWFAVCWGILLG